MVAMRCSFGLSTLAAVVCCISLDAAAADLRSDFARPPFEYKPRPLWFWNAPLQTAEIHSIMERSKQSGYCGFGILPSPGMTPAYLSDQYFARYGDALQKAAQLGQKLTLYDEFWFPSGYVGGQLAKKHPDALCKRLDMLAEDVEGPKAYQKAIPAGRLMGVVAMQPITKERKDLTGEVRDGVLRWDVPEGNWKIMVFTCVRDGARGLVDYLDPDAVRRFVEMTHEEYFRRFPEHFGTTIDGAFYDEPTFHWVQGGRAWTGEFNRKFREKLGYSPVPWYPALWMDVGPDTEAARNALFGFRAELYATGFPKVLQDWCSAHHIKSTGHVDQEEVVNPVGQCGDLMKAFRHQEMPGLDSIFQYGRGAPMYKIVSSAAYNYDRPLVMTELYGAMGEGVGVKTLYKEAMDELAKGVNFFVPHAIWTDNTKVAAPPELSHRSAVYGPALPALNDYLGRAMRILRHGRHVADVGVLYPIATLQAGYRFGVGKPYEGGIVPDEADYMSVGEVLALAVRRDYTFVHPEVLDGRCVLAGNSIRLQNEHNPEQYRVFVIPGSKTIHWSNLKKLKEFYDGGGRVIATTRLPDKSAEFGKDAEVRQAVEHVFGPRASAADGKTPPPAPAAGYTVHVGGNGGRAYFVPKPSAAAIQAALDDALEVYDVQFETGLQVSGGNLSYIHKVIDGADVYFFANSSDTAVDTQVRIRGKRKFEWWDPHTGEIRAAEYAHTATHGRDVTRVRLALPPVKSVFLVATAE